MKAKEFPTSVLEGNAMIFIIVIVALFSIVTIVMMIHDYRLYLEDHWKEKYSFMDFIKHEQFYIYLLHFFFLLILTELWM